MLLYILQCTLFCIVLVNCEIKAAPNYVWPLANTTVHKEVMQGKDAHLPRINQCFVFSDGYPGLPYKAITLTGEQDSFVDFYLDGRDEITDLAFSLLVYPIGEPKGTLLNYLCSTGNVIKVSMLEGLLLISFWDEYGVSVGAMAVPELLTQGHWHHILMSREYTTGRIKVYHDGVIIDDLDDDFPNKIRLPSKGSIRLGSSQKELGDTFNGRFSCFQLYISLPTDEDVKSSIDFCKPAFWKIIPQVSLEEKSIAGVEKLCVTDYIALREDGEPEPKTCDVIDMACLTSQLNWDYILQKYKWSLSHRDSAHFHLIGRDRIPAKSDGLIIGNILVKNRRLCSRLCLRVAGCQAFSSVQTFNASRCIMYKETSEPVHLQMNSVYFTLV